MIGQGLLKVIDMLGLTIAGLEERTAELQKENETLRARVIGLERQLATRRVPPAAGPEPQS